jgi:protease-4
MDNSGPQNAAPITQPAPAIAGPVAPPPIIPPPPRAPVMPPPLVSPPPPRPRGRTGFGWKVLAVVLLVLLLFSVLGNLRHLIGGIFSLAGVRTHRTGPQFQETVLEDNRARSKIAVLDIDGIIGGGYLAAGDLSLVELIASQLEWAKDDSEVRAVILRIDSPGGEVLASDEIARAIREFQEESGKPVIASMGGMAASGGYYVAVPCRWIVANELTITGSIGVIMHGYNYRGLLDKVGVRPEVFKSGRFKDMMRGDKAESEITPEETEMLQKLIDETYKRFKQVVADGRRTAAEANHGKGHALAADWAEYADGRVLSGRQAADLGFVDELGNFKKAVERAKQLAGVSDANLIQYQIPFNLGNLFRLFGKTDVHTVKVDLGLDLPRLSVGRMYFLFLPGAK